jgi:hypothetical protein
MHSKSILIPFCLLLQSCMLFSQAPGYLGKRLFVSANASAIPAFEGPTAGNGGLGSLYNSAEKSLDMTTRFGIEVGYALSRKNAVILTADYAKTGMTTWMSTPSLSRGLPTLDYKDSHYLFYNLNCYTLDLGYQSYKLSKGAIAPMGRYFAFHVFGTMAKGVIMDKRTNYYDSSVRQHAKLGIDPTYITGGIGFEWGNNIIISDHFFMNLSLRSSLTAGLIESKSLNDERYYGTYLEQNQKNFKIEAAERMFNHSLFMIRFGVGMLN